MSLSQFEEAAPAIQASSTHLRCGPHDSNVRCGAPICRDLPLNFRPAAIRASADFTPSGVV
jgi:hypothetical protein